MEIVTEEFDEGDAGSLKMPKVRSLLPARKYRESVKKWGEPTHLNRRRVFIVPSIKCAARDVSIEGREWSTTSESSSNAEIGAGTKGGHDMERTVSYKSWMAERKKLRGMLNGCGLNQDWLARKNARTELESRVLKRLLKGARPEQSQKKVPALTTEDDEDMMSGQDRGVPTIRQPAPAALAMIQEYLDRKKLRLLDLFAQADKDKNWVVSRNEFRNIIKSARIPLTETDLEDLILTLDRDDNDSLDYRELALGRQAFLEERIRNQSAEIARETKPADVIMEETESPSPEQETRPSSPQRPSSPTPSYSATDKQRPDSSPQRPDSLPSSSRPPTANFLSRSSSSPLLVIPAIQLSEKVEQLTQEEIKEKRMNKQRKRKEKEKSKQRKRGVEKVSVAPSTLGGATGLMIDKYRRLQLKECNETVELCHMHGVQLDKKTLERVLLQPEDKPVEVCKSSIKRGLFTISTRHHTPPASTQSSHGHAKRSGSVT